MRAWARAAIVLAATVAVGSALVSGGSGADPQTPPALPGEPPPFLGTALAGTGQATAAIDAYGDVVDLRPSPAGPAAIENPADRQAAGTVPAETGIVPRVSLSGGPARPLWQADTVAQRYLPGTNVVRTTAWLGAVRVRVDAAAVGELLAVRSRAAGAPGTEVRLSFGVYLGGPASSRCVHEGSAGRLDLLCRVGRSDPPVSGTAPGDVRDDAARVFQAMATQDRRWLARARPLGPGAPAWARATYERSLLTLRALTDARTGAVAAGARDGWAYVWPRDAGAAALAFAAAGYHAEARAVAGFLSGLDLNAAARFEGSGEPVPGRAAQGDAAGWAAAAARAAGLPSQSKPEPWRDRADYQESDSGDFLGNAIAAEAPVGGFEDGGGLVRRAGDPGSGLDSAAAWAVRPFPQPALFGAARTTLLRLAARATRFGITPGEGWSGTDPWSAPTAWSAWSLAALGRAEPGAKAAEDRRAALRLLSALHRSATPAGAQPERVDARTGIPRSTTPLGWSGAFAILALRELWPAP